jgi:oxepin-CoA hydrolase/3-oxo-5,6-dehydrosuberyl-CoA semialdehyde dehydrogenase
MLKALALYLSERKEEFYRVSRFTGATRGDSWIDIDGGIGTLFAYASRGRRDFPDETYYVDGGPRRSARAARSSAGTSACRSRASPCRSTPSTSRCGDAGEARDVVLAGMPSIVKPATVTCYLTEVVARAMVESSILPAGSFQLICGSSGDLLDHLGSQDAVAFTGSAATGLKLRSGRAILEHNVRFNQEADSLNFSMLGPDAAPGQRGVRSLREGGREGDDR